MSEETVISVLDISCQIVILLFNFKSYDRVRTSDTAHITHKHFLFAWGNDILKCTKAKHKINFYYDCELFLSPFPKVTELCIVLTTLCGE